MIPERKHEEEPEHSEEEEEEEEDGLRAAYQRQLFGKKWLTFRWIIDCIFMKVCFSFWTIWTSETGREVLKQ